MDSRRLVVWFSTGILNFFDHQSLGFIRPLVPRQH